MRIIKEHPDFQRLIDSAFERAASKHIKQPWWCKKNIFQGVIAGLIVATIVWVVTYNWPNISP